MNKGFLTLACATTLGLVGHPVAASTPPPGGDPDRLVVQEMLPRAELIVRGSVQSVEYRASEEAEPGTGSTPHMFVTYRVDEVLKGAVDGDTVTLRFMGGPVDDDSFVLTPGQPLFDIGDSDLLLVANHFTSDCPLVSCSTGRFRIIDDRVVSEDGQLMLVADDGDLAFGPSLNLADVNTTTLSPTIQLNRIEIGPDGEEIQPSSSIPIPVDPELEFSPEEFFEFMTAAVQSTHTPEELRAARANPFRSADITRPFYMRGPELDATRPPRTALAALDRREPPAANGSTNPALPRAQEPSPAAAIARPPAADTTRSDTGIAAVAATDSGARTSTTLLLASAALLTLIAIWITAPRLRRHPRRPRPR